HQVFVVRAAVVVHAAEGEPLAVAGGAAGVDENHGVAPGGHELHLQRERTAPGGVRPAVDLQNGGIAPALFEADGFHDPAVDGQPVEAFEFDFHDFGQGRVAEQAFVDHGETDFGRARCCGAGCCGRACSRGSAGCCAPARCRSQVDEVDVAGIVELGHGQRGFGAVGAEAEAVNLPGAADDHLRLGRGRAVFIDVDAVQMGGAAVVGHEVDGPAVGRPRQARAGHAGADVGVDGAAYAPVPVGRQAHLFAG